MELSFKFLAHTGIVVAVGAALMSVSVPQAAAFTSPEGSDRVTETAVGKPSPDEPVETKIEEAIEEINQEGQDALEELGELDSPERIDQAEQIIGEIERTSREVRKRAHDRASERFDELNDVAIGRLQDEVRSELRRIGVPDTQEKLDRAEEVRARIAEHKSRLEGRWENHKTRVEQRKIDRELPGFEIRRANGGPPAFAVAYGLRLKRENLTDQQVNDAVAELELESQVALDRLGELDTPGKIERARKIRAALTDRIQKLRQRMVDQSEEQIAVRLEEQAQQLRERADAAIEQLGELDTPEKQQQAQNIEAQLERAVAALRTNIKDQATLFMEEQLDQESRALRRRVTAAMEQLGELDTPEKLQKARRIRANYDKEVQTLRARIARQGNVAAREQVEQNATNLRQEREAALRALGRLDTPEKIQIARQLRGKTDDNIQRLKARQVKQLRDRAIAAERARTNAALQARQRQNQVLRPGAQAVDALQQQRQNQQAVRQNPVRPGVTPVPRAVEPAANAAPNRDGSTASSGGRN